MNVKKYSKGGAYPGGGLLPRVYDPTDRQLRRMTRRAYRRGGTDDVLNMLDQAYRPPNPIEGDVAISGEDLRSLNKAAGIGFPAVATMGPLITAYQQAKLANDPMNRYSPSMEPGPLARLLERIMGMTQ
jgi:hypothetical protein